MSELSAVSDGEGERDVKVKSEEKRIGVTL